MERKCVIIGSFRKNMEEIRAVAGIFKGKGIQVLSPLSFDPIDPDEEFIILKSDKSESSIKKIEKEVIRKMEIADFTYVVNPGGHVGLSTAFELGNAKAAKLTVYSMELVNELEIRESIKDVVLPQDI